MHSSNVYLKKFEELLKTEEKARDLYGYYVDRIEDPNLREQLKEIHEDEKKHVEITRNFIKLISE